MGYVTVLKIDAPKVHSIERVEVSYIAPPPLTPAQVKAGEVADDRKKKQIVEQNEKVNEQRPDKADFLSAKNQKVAKETVAQKRGDFQNVKDNGGITGTQQEETPLQEQKPAKKAAAPVEKPKEHQVAKPDSRKKPNFKDLMAPRMNGEELLAKKQEMEKSNTYVAPQANGSAATPGESSQTNDYLKQINPGLETMLNTREFKYFTYYQRIRRQLSQYWEPKLKEKLTKLFKQGRKIASHQDRITKVLIVLNNSGTLVNVQVIDESGVADLDEAAIEAFRAAAPFPNPPIGIVENDGTVKIRWDFIVES